MSVFQFHRCLVLRTFRQQDWFFFSLLSQFFFLGIACCFRSVLLSISEWRFKGHQQAAALETIHLRRRQIFTNFDPYPPTICIPAKCLWRGFLILMYCDLWTIGTWGHPSPPKTCWRLKWMVPFDILASLNSVFKFKFKFFPQTAKHHIRVIKTFSITFLNKKIAHYRVWNHNAGISGDFKTTLFPFDILASLNSGEPSPCTMSSSRKNNIQRWKLDWEIHSSKHFSKPTSLRAESSISNPTEKSNYHNLFNHIRRWNIWSKTKVWSK